MLGEYGLSDTPDLLGSYGMEGERFDDLSGAAKETGLLTSGVRQNFMKIYIGMETPEVSEETQEAIRQSEGIPQHAGLAGRRLRAADPGRVGDKDLRGDAGSSGGGLTEREEG